MKPLNGSESKKKEEKPENEKRITFVGGQIFQKMITVQSEKGGGGGSLKLVCVTNITINGVSINKND